MSSPTKANRGFRAMDSAKQKEIARKGGASLTPEKRSFSKDRELAARADRKGGLQRGTTAPPDVPSQPESHT